jgi:hypothetical protein
VVLYVMRKNGWTWNEAYAHVMGRRDININMGLQKTLTNIAYSDPSFFACGT